MKEITKSITVDLLRRGNTRLIFARQNDALSRKILIALTAGGAPYPIPSGTQAILNVLRSDGQSSAFSAEVTDGGEVEVTLSLWMLSASGETRCSISLIDTEGKKLTSDDFTIDVLETLYDGEEIATDDNYSLLTALMADIALIEETESERIEAERLREENESARITAENERALAESERAKIYDEIVGGNYGKGGSLTLKTSDFSSDLTATLTVDGLGTGDMISFNPATVQDRELAGQCGLFVNPITAGTQVVFSVNSIPTGDIGLVYFIVRGST
ncbi:MAG: BppU family phage baseplate upper protein [Clostridia bacterium]|nr:BppU family phage baseplate upper protein [Clostridia bacterium]